MSFGEVSATHSKLILSFVSQGVTLPLGSIVISEFSPDSDALGGDEQDLGEVLIGANGDGVFVSNGELGTTFTFKLLQGSLQSKVIDEVIMLQRSGIASVVVSGILVQTDSLQEDALTGGFFTKWMPIPSRGKGALGHPSYTVQFVSHEKAAQ